MSDNKREISLVWALVPFAVMIGFMTATIIIFGGAPHIPLIIGTTTAGLVAWFNDFGWNEIEQALYDGMKQVLPAVVILVLIGILISAWVAGGIVEVMIYYGLQFLSPDYFLPSLIAICAIATLMMGSSWSTIGTLGVAAMAMGTSMGMAAPVVVGAVVSGAFFGDKMSPLSDTTVLASGIAKVDIFEHIRHMLYTTIPALVITFIVFIPLTGHADGQASAQQILAVSRALEANFVLSPWLLLAPLIVPALIMLRVPTIPTLIVAIAMGAAAYVLFQGGDMNQLMNALQAGYRADTDNKFVDELLHQGGLESMMYTVSLAITAMTFGGLMENTGMLNQLVGIVIKLARTGRKLCAATVLSSFVTNIVTAEQYISIIIPARMYDKSFAKRRLHAKNLSRAVEDGGTVTSPLVPWSTDAVFITSTLGISAWSYAPYAVFAYTVPIISILLSLTGFALPQTASAQQAD